MRNSTVSTSVGCLFAFSLVACVLSATTRRRREEEENKIIDGLPVPIEVHPYQLALEGGNRHICGGSILTEVWALTAAHCIYKQPAKWLKFRAWSSVRESGGSVHPVERYIVHEQFDTETVDYDVAVVLVKNSFNFESGPSYISLPVNGPLSGNKVTVLGWGFLEHELLRKPTELMAANVTVLNWHVCKRNYYSNLTPRMLCAGHATMDICNGDSGGPMISGKRLQVGISSWSYRCGDGPSVYTNVTALSSWIIANTGLQDGVITFPEN